MEKALEIGAAEGALLFGERNHLVENQRALELYTKRGEYESQPEIDLRE